MTTIAPARRAWVEQLMGMPVSVHVRGDIARTHAVEECVQAVFDELRAVDGLFSPYRPDSEVQRLNRGELARSEVHPLVDEVLDLCETARVLTDGAFDAYRRDGSSGGRPHVDPTGLVKGWAVERAATGLAGVTGCDVSINAGGDVAGAFGAAGPVGPAWRVGVEDPGDRSRLLAVVPLVAGGVATSGTAARGLHIVRPRDGDPGGRPAVRHRRRAVADVGRRVRHRGVRPRTGRPGVARESARLRGPGGRPVRRDHDAGPGRPRPGVTPTAAS